MEKPKHTILEKSAYLMKRINLILILSSAILISCNSAEVNNPSSSLLPIVKNKEWNYKYEKSDSSISVRITNVNNTSSGTKGQFEAFPFFGDFGKEVIEKNDNSYFLEAQSFMFIPPGDKVKSDYKWESGEWKCTIVSDKQDVNISGKVYKDCVHIRYSLSITFSAEMWLKRGVGIVKWSFIRTNPPSPEFGYFLLKD